MGRKVGSDNKKGKQLPKISIIIPCLNVVRYINECMDSVINQTIKDIEIIVIDGGSTDGTVEILEEYANKDERILLLHSDVKSYGYQVNMGLDKASSEYVAILESDDYVDLKMYETLCRIADKNCTDITKADFDKFYSLTNGYREFTTVRFWEKESQNYNKVLNPREHRILFCNDYFLWKGIYRRSFIEDNGIRLHETPGAAFQDIGFLQQVMATASRVIYVEDSFYRYRTDRDESSSYSPKVLKYGHDEFSWLINMYESGEKQLYLPGLCSHMMQAFTGEMCISLWATRYDFENEFIKSYYSWFKEVIGKFIKNGIADVNELYDITKDQFFEIYDDIEGYITRNKQLYYEQEETKNKLLTGVSEKNIVIFGSGQRGKSTICKVDGKANILAVADNNSSKWGETCMGYSIVSPDEAIEKYVGVYWLVAIKNQEDEIKKQLIDLGVEEEKIIC